MVNEEILTVKNLSVSFKMYDRRLEQKELTVINSLSVSVHKGEIVAIAGSSGSGKSLLAHAILGILPHNSTVKGSIDYRGQPLTHERLEALRGHEIALIPQSVNYLDPLMTAGKQVEGIFGTPKQQEAVFARYGLAPDVARLYPYQLSGGMARRVLLSTAVISGASLIIADEPTPGMSVEMARRAMGHFRELSREGAGVFMITHDIDLAFEYADRIAVFYAGTTVEIAAAADFKEGLTKLRHPYTKALWNAVPQNGFTPIAGGQPVATFIPDASHEEIKTSTGCPFAPRCPEKTEKCNTEIPMRPLRGGEVRCVNAI
ncbi:MAG: ABC transporter ATP-binding protein [Termitinemataceae bacterium]|nr:MAG: ABC transporter ATP-binding protein [Termitinemataceae bacterium]